MTEFEFIVQIRDKIDRIEEIDHSVTVEDVTPEWINEAVKLDKRISDILAEINQYIRQHRAKEQNDEK